MSKYILTGNLTAWGNSIEPPFHEVGPRELTVIMKGPFAETYLEVAIDCEEVEGEWFDDLLAIRGSTAVRLECSLELRIGEP